MKRLNTTIYGTAEYIKSGEECVGENRCFQAAYEKLDETDRRVVDGCLDILQHAKIRNMGRISAMEAVAKLGAFLALNTKTS